MDKAKNSLRKSKFNCKHCKKLRCHTLSANSAILNTTCSNICHKNVCKKEFEYPYFTFKHQTPWKRIRKHTKKGIESLVNISFGLNQTCPHLSYNRSNRSFLESLYIPVEMTNNDSVKGSVFCTEENGIIFSLCLNAIYESESQLTTDLIRGAQHNVNPYKAVFIMKSGFTDILAVNMNVLTMINCEPEEFRGKSLFYYMNKISSHPMTALAEGCFNEEHGSMVLLSGKVVEFLANNGTRLLCSMWMKQAIKDGPSIAFVEPVQKVTGKLIVTKYGTIISADSHASIIFQCTLDQLYGLDIKQIVPSIVLPESKDSTVSFSRKQKMIGYSLDGSTVPLRLSIKYQEHKDYCEFEEPDSKQLVVDVSVYVNVSGLILINEDGIIECVCQHFVMFLFGYPQNEIIGQKITQLLPNFGGDSKYKLFGDRSNYSSTSSANSIIEHESHHLFSPSINYSLESDRSLNQDIVDSEFSDGHQVKYHINYDSEDNCYPDRLEEKYIYSESEDRFKITFRSSKCPEDLLTPINDDILILSEDLENNLNLSNVTKSFHKKNSGSSHKPNLHLDISPFDENDELTTPMNEIEIHIDETSEKDICSLNDSIVSCEGTRKPKLIYSTPAFKGHRIHYNKLSRSSPTIKEKMQGSVSFEEGQYKGIGKHADGRPLELLYTVSKEILQNRNAFCVWVTFDNYSSHTNLENCSVSSSNSSTVDHSLGQAIKLKAAKNKSYTNSVSFASYCEEEQTKGLYNENYITLRQIGKGAFGCVKMAYRKSDKLLVVSKFILKDRVNDEFWIWDETMEKEVPLEISLLPTLTHPNIVTVYDIFENDLYYQLIMEKHGSGMDLFEFIDRVPKLDEPLISYIYRQIASAVEYLHSLHILHRDIKDENIIINQKFEVKLIDFGSATFFHENSVFSTFYGTTEYCSPEVLAGNKYSGPELEMWSMGVTLYVLTYSVNPFEDADETLNVSLKLPHRVSADLEQLLKSLLCKDPLERCTLKQLLSTEWLFQPVDINNYDFAQVVQCDPCELNADQYYISGDMSGFNTPQETVHLSDTNTLPTSFSHIDHVKLQIDSGENTEYYNDDYDESWDEDSFS